jgi:IS30 family transposase
MQSASARPGATNRVIECRRLLGLLGRLRPRFRAEGKLVDQPPAVASQRIRIGEWEGDLIIGRQGGSAVGTLVDRVSKYVVLVHLSAGRRPEPFAAALRAALMAVPAGLRLTLTWDQGTEMARHDLSADLFLEGIYFARPGQPWIRPVNENSNGLLRQYLPRNSDLATLTAEDLAAIASRLNVRPRKTLDWCTPTQVFTSRQSCR